MKKLKLLIASLISAIALVFACVVGTRVNAATTTYAVDFTSGSKVEYVDGEIDANSNYFTTAGSYKQLDGSSTAITGTSIIDGSPISFTNKQNRGIKLDKNGSVSFTTTHSVSLTVLYGGSAKNIAINGTNTGNNATTSTLISTSVNLEAGTHTISKGNGESTVCQVVVVETYETAAITSINSISINNSYRVGDTLTKSDLTVTAKYGEESDPVEISKFDYKVYDSNDVEVTGAFTTAGEGYYVIVTSKEDKNVSKKSSVFAVGEQLIFNYLFSDYVTESDLTDHNIDSKISVNAKVKSNTTSYSFADGASFNSNMAQGNKIDLHLTKAATITVYALQSGSTTGTHDIRYMYFEDSNGNSIISSMNFSVSGTKTDAKVGTVVLPEGDYTSYCSDNGTFNMFAVVIDFTNSESLEPNVSVKLRLEQSTGESLSGGTAARFVGILKGVNYSVIDEIEIKFTLTLSDSTKKSATVTINNVYTGLPGYDVTNDTLYFYFVIKGLEKSTYAGCSIQAFSKVTYTNISENSYSATTWNNA